MGSQISEKNELISVLKSLDRAMSSDNNVGLIEAYFRVYDSDTWDNLFKTQCITIKTSNYDSMDTSTDINGTEVVNQDGIRIVGQYVDENSFWGAAVLLYIENNSDNNVTINEGGNIALIVIFGLATIVAFGGHGNYADLIIWGVWTLINAVVAIIALIRSR